jgi:hypothetical protein
MCLNDVWIFKRLAANQFVHYSRIGEGILVGQCLTKTIFEGSFNAYKPQNLPS